MEKFSIDWILAIDLIFQRGATRIFRPTSFRNPTGELGFKVLDGEIGSADKWPGLKVLGNYPKIIP